MRLLSALSTLLTHVYYPRFAGVEHGQVNMMRNNSLVIRDTSLEHTGHYLCSGVNTAGAAIERSVVSSDSVIL